MTPTDRAKDYLLAHQGESIVEKMVGFSEEGKVEMEKPKTVWVVRCGYDDPARIDGIYRDRDLAIERAKRLGGGWFVEQWTLL